MIHARHLVLIVLLATWSPATATAQSPLPRMPLGTNISGMDDWSSELTFLDVFRSSRPWISGTRTTWNDGRALDLDDRGWVRSLQPGQFAKTLMLNYVGDTGPKFPAGQYTVTWEGEGTIEYPAGAQLVSHAAGRDVIDLAPGRGIPTLQITSVTPANYLRNIRVRMPVAAAPDEAFYPVFLERIEPYTVIRFINWMLGQNGTWVPSGRWADRPRVDDARWSVKGVPIETMIALCNRVEADPWFTIPHTADDEYVREFARLAQRLLAPGRKMYIEHSNEVWNGQFAQARYAQERGLALGLDTNPFTAQMKYHALRSRQIFEIVEQEVPRDRLVRVIAVQAVSTWQSDTILNYGTTRAHTDALAIAPYFTFHYSEEPVVAAGTLDALFTQLDTVVLPRTRQTMAAQMDVARRQGVPLITYEGGQHFVVTPQTRASQPAPTIAALEALYTAANRDPRMGAVYSRYLQDWNDVAGTGLFNHLVHCFFHNQNGRFGSLEYIDQPRGEAYKYDALMRWIEGSAPHPPGDGDADGMPDAWEVGYGFDPANASDAGGDADGDGRTNLQEYQQGSHPRGTSVKYLAEGATGSFFETRIALLNATAGPADVLVHYQKADGGVVSQRVALGAHSRATLQPASLPGMDTAEFSTLVESDVSVQVDRLMAWGAGGYGAHAETAVAAPAQAWFLAEGFTSAQFNLFYLLQNPGDAPAHVTVRYLLPSPAPPIDRTYTVGAHARSTIWVNQEGGVLASSDVSAAITADVPIIVERALYLDGADVFAAGHDSAAVAGASTRWMLAEGATGTWFDTFILVANPNADAADLRVDYLLPSGETFSRVHRVEGNSRATIWVDHDDARLASTSVSTTVTSTNAVPVVVERSMWWGDAAGWYEAHNSPGAIESGTLWAVAEGEAGGARAVSTYLLVANVSDAATTAVVTLYFEDGATDVRSVPVPAHGRATFDCGHEVSAAIDRRFGATVESQAGAPIVVESAMYWDAGGRPWAAGTNALATRVR